MLGGGRGVSFDETTSDDDGGSDRESGGGGSGHEPSGGVEQGWFGIGLDVFGKILFEPLGAFPLYRLQFLGRVLILATLVVLAGAVSEMYSDAGGGAVGMEESLQTGLDGGAFGLEVVDESGAAGRWPSRVLTVLASLGVSLLGDARTTLVVVALLLLDSVASAPILVIWPSTATGRVTSASVLGSTG